MSTGWIKIHRKILNWEWYWDLNTKAVFLHLLLTANNTDRKVGGTTIRRGELVTSYNTLSEQLNMSVRNVRTAVEHLMETKEIDKQNGKPNGINGMVITICKYDNYNEPKIESDILTDTPTDKPPTNPKRKSSPTPPKKEIIEEEKKVNTNVFTKESENDPYMKFIEWVNNNAPYCYRNMKMVSEVEFYRLKSKYTSAQIVEQISQIENRVDLRKRYSSLYRTLLNWLKKEFGDGTLQQGH